jgi:hypothetical protein
MTARQSFWGQRDEQVPAKNEIRFWWNLLDNVKHPEPNPLGPE